MESKIEKLMRKEGWSVRYSHNYGVEYRHFVKGDLVISEEDISLLSEEEMEENEDE